MKRIMILLLITLFLLVSCKTVDEDEAESIATEFVKSRVVFFTRQNTSQENVQDYETSIMSSNRAAGKWYVSVQILYVINNTEKQKTLPVTIDARSGTVNTFNNMPVVQRR